MPGARARKTCPHQKAPPCAQVGLQSTAFAQFKAELADKDKKKANNRAGALRGLRAIVEKIGQPAESHVTPFLGAMIEALADKAKPVSVEAEKLQNALFNNLSPHAVMVRLLPAMRPQAHRGHTPEEQFGVHGGGAGEGQGMGEGDCS